MCREQGVTIIYNGTYSSQFMPVEMIWNMAKVYWRREIINVPNFSNKANLRHHIELCIKRVKPDYLKLYIEKTKQMM